MPRGDGTGPMGAGAMTGRGNGYCTGSPSSPGARVRGGTGPAWGRGAFGGRRGGWGKGICSGEMEKNLLKNQSQALQAELELIKSRLAQLENEKKEE
jgi:hypothetical protein